MVHGIDIEFVFVLHDHILADLEKKQKKGWWYATSILAKELDVSPQQVGQSLSWMEKQTCSHYEGRHLRRLRVERWSKTRGSTKWRVERL